MTTLTCGLLRKFTSPCATFFIPQNLKLGTVLLGCVRELLNFEVVLGLPSGLKGYMPISSICDVYTKILSSALDSGTDLEVIRARLCSLHDPVVITVL